MNITTTLEPDKLYDYLGLEDRILSYFNMMYSLALSLTADAELSKDLTQDAALKIISAKPEVNNLGAAYFKQTIRSVVRDHWRDRVAAKRPQINFMADDMMWEMSDGKNSVETTVIVSEMLSLYKKECTAREWEVISLHSSGYTVDQVGEIVSISRRTVLRDLAAVVTKCQAKQKEAAK